MCDVRLASNSTQEHLDLRQRFCRFLETGEQRYIPTRTADATKSRCGQVNPLRRRQEIPKNGHGGTGDLTLKTELGVEDTTYLPDDPCSKRISGISNVSHRQGNHSAEMLEVGRRVLVSGLKNRPEFNGQEGSLLGPDGATGRWRVAIENCPGLSLKPGNLQMLPDMLCAPSSSSPTSPAGMPAMHSAENQKVTSVRVAGLQSSPELNGCESNLVQRDSTTERVPSSPGSASNSSPNMTFASVAGNRQCREILEPGCQVRVTGLKSRPELNGHQGSILSLHESSERWNIMTTDGSGLSLRSENLEVLPGEACLPSSSSSAHAGNRQAANYRETTRGMDALEAGMQVRVTGLRSRPELNGRVGSLLELDGTTGRWNVVMIDHTGLSLKPNNLEKLMPGNPSPECAIGMTCASVRDDGKDAKTLEAGMQVRVVGLRSRPELNGRAGSLLEFDVTLDRWNVLLTDGSGLSLKSEHVEILEHGACSTIGPSECIADMSRASCREDGQVARTLQAGIQVQVTGLESRPELNGRLGSVLAFDDAIGQWNVVMTDGSEVSLRPDNLQLLGNVPCLPSDPSARNVGMPSASRETDTQSTPVFEAGMHVRVAGLTSRPELNGREASVLELDGATGRWNVVMADGSGLSLRSNNLQKLEGTTCVPSTSSSACAADATAECCRENQRETSLLRAGMYIRVAGLMSRPELNGCEGRLLGFSDATGRWSVAMRDGSELSLKSHNLEQSEVTKSSPSSPVTKTTAGEPAQSGIHHGRAEQIVEAGTLVRVAGLKSRPELNGCEGSLLELDGATGRWNVSMKDGSGLSLKPENFERLEPVPFSIGKPSSRGAAESPAATCAGTGEVADLFDAVTRCPPSSPSSNLVADDVLHEGVALEAGMRVRVFDMLQHPEINSCEGSLLGFDGTTGKWNVAMDDNVERSLCPQNLRWVGDRPAPESTLVQASSNAGQSASTPAVAAAQSTAELEPGMRVRLITPRHRPDVDGYEGSLLKFNAAQNSWDVVLDDGSCLKLEAGSLEWVGNMVAAFPNKILGEAEPSDVVSFNSNLLVSSPKESSSVNAAKSIHIALVPDLQGAQYPGAEVEITGIRTKPQLNGCRALLVRLDETCKRWEVSFGDGSFKMLRPENLRILRSESQSTYRSTGGSIPSVPEVEWELTD